ncbi:MAG TPA: response regulator [Planctomycetota bacterium]
MNTSEKKRILVVDDCPMNAKLAARIGRFGGFEVREAHSAVDGAAIARAWKPELIIVDVVMPDMDGSELCVVLKSDAATRDIPVLFVSGYAGDQFAPLGEFCGGADFLAKPYSPPKLLRLMNRMTGVQSAAPTR